MNTAVLSGVADILWPLIFVGLLWSARPQLKLILASGADVAFEFMGNKISVTTPKRSTQIKEPGVTGEGSPDIDLDPQSNIIPADYVFLNHTSFLRPELQAEFQAKTGVICSHYDIRVIADSYYKGALDRVEKVEYLLDESYPESIQVRTRKSDKFLLKEIANGESLIIAKVYLRDRKNPLILQRFVTLWESGPRIQ
jgi:hypothetical protein